MLKQIIFLLLPFITFGQSFFTDVELMLEKKDYTKAEILLEKYLKSHPNQAYAIELLGDTYVQQKKWEEATIVFEQLISLEPVNANFHYKYGHSLGMDALNNNKLFALFMMNDVKEEFLLAAKLDTIHIDARWALVVYFTELPGIFGGSVQKALAFSEELQLISPVDGYLAKGYIYEYDQEYELAQKNYKKAIIEGGSYTCYNKLVLFYKNNNQPQKAISVIEKAYQKLNKDTLNYQLGEVSASFNVALNKGELSLKKYLKNTNHKEENSLKWAYFRLAQIYNLQGDKDNALFYIDKVLESDPKFKPAIKEKKIILSR